MPNWTFCTLEAPAEVIDKYLTKDEKGHINFDFNKVIPRPKDYDDPDLSEGGDTEYCIYWYLNHENKLEKYPDLIKHIPDYIIKKYKHFIHTNEACRRGQKYVNVYEKYGYPTWYQWSLNNWGTKWNACDTYYDPETPTRVEFNTAWCFPRPIIKKIFHDNAESNITFTFYDEDYDGHHVLFQDKNGGIFEDEYWVDECANDYEEPDEQTV